jgi:cardiolipin synthase
MRGADPLLRWRPGNRLQLLENGEAFYARAFAAIDAAQREIQLETFILFEDEVGRDLHARLVAAARRGVRVQVLVDGYGSPAFSPGFLEALAEAGAVLRTFDPHRTLFGLRLHIFRRMHRKLLVVDGRLAFVGGINYSADHLSGFGPKAKQDYAVEVEGPVVADIHRFVLGQDGRSPAPAAPSAGDADAAFVLRDNTRHTTDIERVYRSAIRAARSEIVIANAYFFPGYGFLRDLRRAARRGVRVRLILQGEPDMPAAMLAARSLYRHLLQDGVSIHEYSTRPFHGKVALVDEDWATVGSSNLDPLSLSLNLEANLVVRDRAFNRQLRERMERLWCDHCRQVDIDTLALGPGWRLPARLPAPLLYHVLRRFPSWAGLLPAHTPRVVTLTAPEPGVTGPGDRHPLPDTEG